MIGRCIETWRRPALFLRLMSFAKFIRQQHAAENLMLGDISGNMQLPDEDVNDHQPRANTPKPFQD